MIKWRGRSRQTARQSHVAHPHPALRGHAMPDAAGYGREEVDWRMPRRGDIRARILAAGRQPATSSLTASRRRDQPHLPIIDAGNRIVERALVADGAGGLSIAIRPLWPRADEVIE